jgi:CDP-diacylglycerol pyrophosphatase
MTIRIRPPATSVAALLGLLGASPAVRAASPDALWKIVHGRCVPDEQLHKNPSPCTYVSLAGGEAHGYAILKDIKGATQFLLIPTDRITGIESPKILADDAPNYFAAAWAARSDTEAVFHHPLPREDMSLAINSPHARSQEQLHIHIDCLQPAVVAALHAHEAAIGPAWAPLGVPLQGHPYRARWLSEAGLASSNPFKLLAADVGAAAMGLQTLVVAGAVSASGRPGFVLLADHVDPATSDRAGGEELQDHSCAVAYP